MDNLPAIPSRARISPRRAPILVLAILAAVVLGSACGGDAGGTGRARSAAEDPKPAAVTIDTFMFSPRTLRVRTGTTVVWTNRDSILHTVTSGTRTYDPNDSGRVVSTAPTGVFNLMLDGRNATGRFTFTKPGVYRYFCNRHPGMEAEIRVT